MALPRYRYSALESPRHIRLMKLWPESFSHELHCSLEHVSLDSELTYRALSYVWGQGYGKEHIICDNAIIPITPNLKIALLRFRDADNAIDIWVDSITIDQANLDERAMQVQIMGEIFRTADMVILWIGEEDEQTALAYACLHAIFKYVVPIYKLRPGGFGDEISDIEHFRESWGDIPSITSAHLKSVGHLLKRPWFRRAWTFQEGALARRSLMCCGPYEISDERICEIYPIFGYLRSPGGHVYEYFGDDFVSRLDMLVASKVLRTEPTRQSFQLLNLLSHRRGSEAKEPHDQFYSLMGLANDINPSQLQVDYRKRAEDLFVDFVHYTIHSRQDLHILGHADSGKESQSRSDKAHIQHPSDDPQFPTWVPDWTCPPSKCDRFSRMGKKKFLSTGTSRPKIRATSDKTKLYLRGWSTMTIKRLANYRKDCEEVGVIEEAWSALAQLSSSDGLYKPTAETIAHALERTMRGGNPPKSYQYVPADWTSVSQQLLILSMSISRDEDARRSRQAKASHTAWKRLFVTSAGFLGVAPFHAQEGDVVCLLLGGEVPYLLRPSGNEYTFVSECYVHGMMDGEWLVVERARLLKIPLMIRETRLGFIDCMKSSCQYIQKSL